MRLLAVVILVVVSVFEDRTGRARGLRNAFAMRCAVGIVGALEVDAHLILFRRPAIGRGVAPLAAAVLAA